jgi:hypothetical protein
MAGHDVMLAAFLVQPEFLFGTKISRTNPTLAVLSASTWSFSKTAISQLPLHLVASWQGRSPGRRFLLDGQD